MTLIFQDMIERIEIEELLGQLQNSIPQAQYEDPVNDTDEDCPDTNIGATEVRIQKSKMNL